MDALRGIWLVARTPQLWPLCFLPLLAALAVYVVVGVVGGVLLVKYLPIWFHFDQGGREWWLTRLLGGLAAVGLWLVLFNFVFVLLGGVFSGLVWDRLGFAVEQIAAGEASAPAQAPLGCGAQAGDSLSRLVLNVTLGVAAFVLGFALGPVPGVFVASLVGLLDYTAPACLRRGLTLGPQWARLRRSLDRDILGFALLAGLLSLIPLVGVLLLPGLVAGGTLLVLRKEDEKKG